MKIHTIQTGSVAIKTRQRQGVGKGMMRLINMMTDPQWTDFLPINTWVIEHPEGLIVVDTGETARTAEPGYFPRWHPYYRFGVRMAVRPQDEIGPQMARLGFSTHDVRWVILTHLHTDHAGGLHHFPKSEILVSRAEYRAAVRLGGMMNGYLRHQWPSWFVPTLIDFPDNFDGLFPSMPLTQSGDVHLVATPGHSVGHTSVIVQDGDQTVFLAGDTSYAEQFMRDQVVDGVSPDVTRASDTLRRIHTYVQRWPTTYVPCHDPDSAARLAVRQIVPVEPTAP